MCGIGGWFSVAAQMEEGTTRLSRLSDALRHRGPDGTATLEIDHVGMAHARLAMIDLVSGDQPMWNVDKSSVIVFNGEIFNYRELRAFYEARGAQFASRSDTEVILAAYQIDGLAGFGRLRGMFAFALWDVTRQAAVLVRDPLGIKPLFVHVDDRGNLAFASEGKGIFATLGERPTLDENALHSLLNFRYVLGDASLFRSVRQLEPGECLQWEIDGKCRRSQISVAGGSDAGDLEQVLSDSVRAHLVADVRVGCYLSGGIDSGLIAALAGRCDSDMPTFTLAVGDDPQEAVNAAETARLLGLSNVQASLDDDELKRLPRMLWHLETPKVNAVQLFRLAELARTQAKAALSGVGGDELFAGYNAHRIIGLAQRLPARATAAIGGILCRMAPSFGIPFSERRRAMQMGAAIGDWPRVYALLRNVWDSPELRRWLYGPRLLDLSPPDATDLVRKRWPAGGTPLVAMMDFEWRNKMVNDLLWQEDRASMAAGLEVRVPFVDVVVQATVAKLGPPQLGKRLLRTVAERYLPKTVLARPKSGFQLDAPAFFDAHLRPLARVLLAPERVRDYGLFNPTAVAELLRLPAKRGYRWHFFMLYLMIQTHLWIEIFERGQSHDSLDFA